MKPSPIQKALDLPNGAHFVRFALQVNPHGYAEQYRGEQPTLSKEEYNRVLAERCDLGEFGIRDTTSTAQLSSKTLQDLLQSVRDHVGIAIAAHATSECGGFLKVLAGQARINAWQDKNLLLEGGHSAFEARRKKFGYEIDLYLPTP